MSVDIQRRYSFFWRIHPTGQTFLGTGCRLPMWGWSTEPTPFQVICSTPRPVLILSPWPCNVSQNSALPLQACSDEMHLTMIIPPFGSPCGLKVTPAPNADSRRATSLQCAPRRLRLANGSSPGSAAMPRFSDGSDCVCWRGDRITCVRWPADSTTLFCIMAITDRALRQASVAERPVALPPVDPTKGATHGLTAFHLSTN
jgi:hypothetical protein